jgi:alpha-beta hydrolase superfamily lysophospholipase
MENRDTGYFLSSDRKKLFYQLYCPQSFHSSLLILHGHGEHSGRYEKFFTQLKNQSVAVALFDFRGHGRSEGVPAYVEGFGDFLEDVTFFHSFLQNRYGISPKIVLLGHSMGGLVALHWALQYPNRIQNLILSSPCLGIRSPKWFMAFNQMMNRYVPRWTYSNPVFPPHLTHDPEEIRKYRTDPLIQRKISVRLLYEMVVYASKIEAMDLIRVNFPVDLLTASDEKIVDLARVDKFYRKLDSSQKNRVVFQGFNHEIFNDLGQDQVFEKLRAILRTNEDNIDRRDG